jgi:glutamate synthase (NADPH/NADH) small chain
MNERLEHDQTNSREFAGLAPKSSVNPVMAVPPWPAKHAWFKIRRAEPPKRIASERVHDFGEVYSLLDETTVREQASRCIQCPEPLCRTGCPLGNLIPDWLALTADGRFLEAAALSRSTSNMPEICSRVCPQERLCEGSCILNARSDPVAIGAIEKFINEYAFRHNAVEACPVLPNGLSVAVAGSGPGGMACADELAKLGYAVTIFDSQNRAGGLLVNGIPSFKLEKSVVERRLDLLRKRGVTFRLGVKIGRDISLAVLRATFDAVYLAFGAQQPKPLKIPGAHLDGVFDALPFLVEKNLRQNSDGPAIDVSEKRVVVLGGGDTAMDCLRTALRCGAHEAICVYRRDLENMPGSRKEYANALEEGAQFVFLTNPVALLGDSDGRVAQVRCERMELGEPDTQGRRKPRPIAGSEFVLPADVVLIAYGFDPAPFPTPSGLERIALNPWGCVTVNPSQMTSVSGVFAGGDLVRGPSLVAHAVHDGRQAAAGIHQYLQGVAGFRPPLHLKF